MIFTAFIMRFDEDIQVLRKLLNRNFLGPEGCPYCRNEKTAEAFKIVS